MALYRFGPNDVFVSSVKAYPNASFLIYSGSYYYNSKITSSGSFSNPIRNVPQGHISLYELNVDRNSAETGLIYPFIIKSIYYRYHFFTNQKFNNPWDAIKA